MLLQVVGLLRQLLHDLSNQNPWFLIKIVIGEIHGISMWYANAFA